MNNVRPIWALAALTLILTLAACGTTDVAIEEPQIEAQFGTRDYDSVVAVAYGKAKKLYVVGDLGNDAYLRRYDSAGSMLWERYLDPGAPYNEWEYQYYTVSDVAVDATGNAFVSWYGSFDNNDGGVSQYYLTKYDINGGRKFQVVVRGDAELVTDTSGNVYGNFAGAYLTKYTSTGSKSWERALSGTRSITVSSANNIYAVRSTGYIHKYSSGGTQVWAKKLVPSDSEVSADDSGCTSECSIIALHQLAAGISDEFVAVGGRFLSDFDGDSCGSGEQALSLLRFDKNGVRQTSKTLASLYYSFCGYAYEPEGPTGWTDFGITTDTAGNFYLATGRNNDGSVTKLSRTGAQVWSKGFGTPFQDAATSAAVYDGSEVFVGGVTRGFLVHRQLGKGDAVLRKMDINGNQVWTR